MGATRQVPAAGPARAAAATPLPADPVGALCAEHGYPPEVEALLREVVRTVAPVRPASVFLHGSAARGELTWWRDEAGRVQLGSDLEMYVVVDRPPDAEAWRRADGEVRALQARANQGGPRLFHVDVGAVSRERFRRHPRTFRCWDMRETGRALLGEDVRGELPALDAATIDLRQLNEVPIHRLWEMAFRVPRALLLGGATAEEERTARYVWARQALDLTTWLLPHCGVMVPTFRRRVAAWRERFAELPLARFFPADSPDLLDECLEGKLHLRFRRPPARLHADVLEHFRAGLRMVLRLAPDADDAAVAEAAVHSGGACWHGETPRRRAYEAYLLLRDGQALRPRGALGWLLRRKKPRQVAFLLHLNAALAALLAGDDAAAPLERAEGALAKLWYGFRPAAGTQAERFLAARRGYVDYLAGSSRWFGPRREYLYSVLDEGKACVPA